MYNEKSIDPRKEPWGTPAGHSRYDDIVPSTLTHCLLSDKCDLNHAKVPSAK